MFIGINFNNFFFLNSYHEAKIIVITDSHSKSIKMVGYKKFIILKNVKAELGMTRNSLVSCKNLFKDYRSIKAGLA